MCVRISASLYRCIISEHLGGEKMKTLNVKLAPKCKVVLVSDFLTINSEYFSVLHTGPLLSVGLTEKHEGFVFYANANILVICESVTMGMEPTTIITHLSLNQANIHLRSMREQSNLTVIEKSA